MNSKLRKLTESGILLAMAVVLSMITIYKLPNGGSVTAASMVPVILISYRYGTGWGVFSAFVYSLLQMLLGFYAPPVQDFASFALVILLDYVVAFGCLGLASAIAKPFGGPTKPVAITISTAIVCLIRMACHIVSGIIIWGVYAPEGMPVWLYSAQYNGSYMLVELVLSAVVGVILARYIDFTTFKPVKRG